jgi:hypothetical protein
MGCVALTDRDRDCSGSAPLVARADHSEDMIMRKNLSAFWTCWAVGLLLILHAAVSPGGDGPGKLKVESDAASANVFVIKRPMVPRYRAEVEAWGWTNLSYPWLSEAKRGLCFTGQTPVETNLAAGDYVVAVQISIMTNDATFRVAEVGRGAIWSDRSEGFEFVVESGGWRMGKNGERFANRQYADQQDPFVPDSYSGSYVHRLADRIMYFRIYEVAVRGGAETKLTSRFVKKRPLPTSESPGSTGLIRNVEGLSPELLT